MYALEVGLMELMTLLRQGCRIRRSEWPPYHYAEVRQLQDGKELLCRVLPFGEIEILGTVSTALCEPERWASAGLKSDF
jgi:hypothetical protein